MNSLTGSRGPSRRTVLQGSAAIGTAALITPWGTPLRAEPVRGGTLRVGMAHGSTTDSMDPGTWDSGFSILQAHTSNNYLSEIAADGSLIPELAESWEASADATTWTFTLRSGVQYHSGHVMTAEDVIASINHHRGEDSTSAAAPIVADITDITADGMNVIFTLSAGNADFPFVMSDYHLAIVPAQADGSIDATGTDGCGPYAIEDVEAGVGSRLVRHDGYWKPNTAWFDAVELIVIFDNAARQNALVSGQVDYIDTADLNTVHLLERAPGIEILSVTGTQHYGLPMDTRAAPFDDINVRMALKFSIDRQQLVDTILNGHGTLGNDHPIGPGQRFFNTELEQREYDPDRAQFHLREAGLESLDVDIHLADAAFAGAMDTGVLFAESAAASGININVVREPNDGYWSNVWMQEPFVGTYWSGRPTADWMFSTAYTDGAPWNETYWSHERFNMLVTSARSELDEDLRREQYFEMQQIVSDEGGTIIPMFAAYVGAHSDTLARPEQIATNWRNDGQRIAERWWFAA
ncbi:MAG TPA: ABC transporter substrate-binding protein [Roseibacterium sp.]|nr:ABC transporter substrate-binding protein [Roseibacterium sp.]